MVKKTFNEIDPDQMVMLTGQDSYGHELPDGDHDVQVRWYSDKDCVVWFNFDNTGDKSVPVLTGKSGNQTLRAKHLCSVEITTDKKATVCAQISYRPLTREDPLDFTPVEITPPPPAQLQMSSIISQEVVRQLEAMGINVHEQLEVSDEDDLEEEDDDGDEFGPGYMDDDPLPETNPAGPAEPPGGAPVEGGPTGAPAPKGATADPKPRSADVGDKPPASGGGD